MSDYGYMGEGFTKRNYSERRKGHDKHSGGQPPQGWGHGDDGKAGGIKAPGKPRNPKPYLPMARKIERA